ncbi:MAG: TonB family protein, partial [Candidatus Omnitrophica bacterium]|nr:TonB family protein [Candidatus Omnitrophota bacterium]
DSTPHTEILYPISAIIDSETYLDIKGPERLLKKDIFLGDGKAKTLFREKSYLTEKVKPGYFMNGRSIFYHVEEKILNRFIEGPARSRAVLFKPQFPLVSKLSYGDEENLMTRLKFTLSKEGNVELVEPVVSSGYPRIDLECIKYIKQWKFSPKAGADQKKEWGIITLNINLE